MGFTAFWTTLLDRRVKEITPHRPFSFEYSAQQEQQTINQSLYGSRGAAVSEVVLSQPATDLEEKRERRKSRTFSLSKPKSEGDPRLKRRRSWWGGKPAAEDAPAVPALPAFARDIASAGGDDVRPGTALTADVTVEDWQTPATPVADADKRKSRRLSLGNALRSRKRSQSNVTPKKMERRQSVLGGHRDLGPPPVPDVPALPTSLPVEEDRRSERTHLTTSSSSRFSGMSRPRTSGTQRRSKKRSSWWQSSNPDDDDDVPEYYHMPAVPALVNDGSVTPNTSSPDNSDSLDALFGGPPVRTATRGSSIKAPRPVSGLSLTSQKRKTYTPRSAEKGFLRSTSGRRSSYRHSLLDDGEGGMICLSDEQQREWDKLKHLMDVMDKRADAGVIGMLRELEEDEQKHDRKVYSDQAALAALEYGQAR